MSKVIGLLLFTVLVVVIGGGMFLATSDSPPVKARVEKVIPNDRLGH